MTGLKPHDHNQPASLGAPLADMCVDVYDWLSFIYIFLNFYTFLILMLFVRFFFYDPDTSHKLKQIKSNKLGSHATTWIHVLSLQNVLSNQINTNCLDRSTTLRCHFWYDNYEGML